MLAKWLSYCVLDDDDDDDEGSVWKWRKLSLKRHLHIAYCCLRLSLMETLTFNLKRGLKNSHQLSDELALTF